MRMMLLGVIILLFFSQLSVHQKQQGEQHEANVCFVSCVQATNLSRTDDSSDQHKTTVFFAGVSYLGDANKVSARYPYAYEFNQTLNVNKQIKSNQLSLDEAFTQMVKNKSFEHLTIKTGLANLRKGQNIVLSLAIEQERVVQEDTASQRKLIFEVDAQLLFMDFSTMSLRASYPITLAYNHVIALNETAETVAPSVFRNLYYSKQTERNKGGLLAKAVEQLHVTNINEQYPLRLQLASLGIAEKITNKLTDSTHLDDLKHYLAHDFTRKVASAYRLSMLPFTKGYAIGNKMSGRFANGDIYQLLIPKPDYVFDISLIDINKVKKGKNNLFATRIDFRFSHMPSQQQLIAGKYHYAVAKSALFTTTDSVAPYEDAAQELFSEIISQLSSPSKSWHNSHSSNKKISFQQFTRNKELFVHD